MTRFQLCTSRACSTFLAATLFIVAAANVASAQDLGPTLRRAASPPKPVSSDGFIQRWLVLEPIRASGLTDSAVRSALKVQYFTNQLSVLPKPSDSVTYNGTNLTWHALETTNYNVNLFHFARALSRPTSDVMFWAVTVIESPEDMTDARLAIGSNAASVWWVNGQEVIDIYGDRQTVIDDGVSKRITLKKGANVVRCVIINGGGATDFCARFLDKHDKPLTNLTVSLAAQ